MRSTLPARPGALASLPTGTTARHAVPAPRRLARTAVLGVTASALAISGTLALAPAATAAPGTPLPPATDSSASVPAADPAAAVPAVDPAAAVPAAAAPTLTKAQRKAAREARRAAKVKALRAKVVKVARAQLRDSYVAGASGPNAFDCSGFTRFVWRQAGGKNLPHYSRAQFGMGRKVSVGKARPGDLVFYFGGGAHHVGLYIGNNKMIHAANPRVDVTVSHIKGPWYGSRFSGIRSIVRG